MKNVNLFIIKRITENMELSDEAFTVWCGLRSIMEKDETEYFINYNRLACAIFNRVPNRRELDAVKVGFNELLDKKFVKIIYSCNKTDHIVDLSKLYFDGDEFFTNITSDEMHKIMNIKGQYDKYKMLRYFCCQIGSFNRSNDMYRYKGKIGGMNMGHFEKLIPINKSTVIIFNKVLMENQLLFVIRHKDFFQGITYDGNSTIREIPNTYSRWDDRNLAIEFAENIHGYKYHIKDKDKRTDAANKNRSLGQKLNNYIYNHVEYDDATISEMREYAEKKNTRLKEKYEDDVSKGYHPEEPVYIDMTVFGAVG